MKKSKLQERLEEDGWHFIGNEGRLVYLSGMKIGPDDRVTYNPRILLRRLPSDEDLIKEHKAKGWKQVIITTAYSNERDKLDETKGVYGKM